MVLSVYCVSFFAPPGEKMTHEELNIIGTRKSSKREIPGLRCCNTRLLNIGRLALRAQLRQRIFFNSLQYLKQFLKLERLLEPQNALAGQRRHGFLDLPRRCRAKDHR